MRTMYDLIYGLPGELKDAWQAAEAVALPRLPRPRQIVVSGMGGSGIGGDLLQGLLLARCPLPVVTVKDYTLPRSIDRESLFFAISFSGNTEETIAGFQQALRLKCPRIVISGGGRLTELAREHRDPLITVSAPAGCPPRAALPYLFTPLLVTLCRFRLIPDLRPDLKETIRVLTDLRTSYRVRARNLARELKDRVPVIYSTSRLLDAVANRWRCQFNENAKVFAHCNSFPELCHNEIVGMGNPRAFARLCYLLVLSDPDAHERNSLRYELTLEILKKEYAEARVLQPDGRSDLSRVFSFIMFGDLLSYYLAAEREVDPIPVRRIEELKKRLAAVE